MQVGVGWPLARPLGALHGYTQGASEVQGMWQGVDFLRTESKEALRGLQLS